MTATSGAPARPSELDDAAEAAVSSVLARCGVHLRRTANLTINDNTLTTMSWDQEDEDTDGFWAIGTPTVVTIPAGKGGIYGITFMPDIVAVLSAGARGFVDIVVTSSITGHADAYRSAIDALGERAVSTTILRLAAGDTFICRVQADMAAGSTMTGFLFCYRLGL